MKRVGIIGLGRVGSALAYTLRDYGYDVAVVSRRVSPGEMAAVKDKKIQAVSLTQVLQEAELLFIATPDGIIGEIVTKLQDYRLEGKAVLHMSGAHSSALLVPLREQGALIGSLHPLQSFATVEQALENLPGSYFTYEGDQLLLEEVRLLVEKWGGVLKILSSAETKVIYHAGACLASNYLVALAWLGVHCLNYAGFSEEEAREALTPLMQGTVNNIARLPLTKALTGPISRGDLEVVRNHTRVLAAELPEVNQIYCFMAPFLGKLALEGQNITVETYRELLQMLMQAFTGMTKQQSNK